MLFLKGKNLFDLKALAEIVVTKVMLIATDVITLPGLYNCLYVYIFKYSIDDCNTLNLKMWKKVVFYPFLEFAIKVST